MGIDVISSKVVLNTEQEMLVNNFVNKHCSHYYFLNFIKMTSGNVEDAIELYYFDEELRIALIKYILRFEIQLKRDLLIA